MSYHSENCQQAEPEFTNVYADRKNQELRLVYSVLGLDMPSLETGRVHELKMAATRKAADCVSHFGILPPTPHFDDLEKFEDREMSGHTYQRFNFRPHEQFPNGLTRREWIQKGQQCIERHYNSGMAAISTILTAYNRACGDRAGHCFHNDLYFETTRSLSLLGYSVQNIRRAETQDDQGHLLYLDTSTIQDSTSLQELIDRCSSEATDLIVVDNTCPLASGCRIWSKFDIPIVVIESHMKLSQLGFELCQYGTALLVVGSKISLRRQIFLRAFLEGESITAKAFATEAGQSDAGILRFLNFPHHHHVRCREINLRNCGYFVKEALESAVSHSPLLSEHFTHGLYFILSEFKDFNSDVQKVFWQVSRSMSSHGVEVKWAASFGFDVPTFDTLEYDLKGRKRRSLRVSPGDLCIQQCKAFADALAGAISDICK